MKAEIIAIGSEILLGDIVNTNAQYLSRELATLGIDVYHQQVVGDNEERLLKAVYDGRLACWVYVREKDVVCVVTTTISTDFCTGQKTLLIFSMYSILEMNQSEWFAGIDFLRKHAKSIGCVNLIAYKTNKSLGRVLREKVAANTEWILLKMEV